MIKLPEPVGQFQAVGEFFDVDAPTEYEKSLGWEAIYTEAQLKQAVRDALELAFQVAGPEDSYQDERFKAKADSAMRVRALIEEIE